jgi:hypothetical protein
MNTYNISERGECIMPKIDISQIKDALTAANKASKAKNTQIRQKRLTERSEMQTNKRLAEQLLTSYLTKTGFEVDKLNKIIAQNEAKLRSIREIQKADAVKHSSSAKIALHQAADSKLKALEYLKTLISPPNPQHIIIDPFYVWQTHGTNLVDSNIEPHKSWAKIKVASNDKNGEEELKFYFYWQNPSNGPAVINVDGFFILNGHCIAGSPTGWAWGGFGGGYSTALYIVAYLELFEYWNNPFTYPLHQDDQIQYPLILEASESDWGFNVGDIEGTSLYRGCDIRYNYWAVPAHEIAIFQMCFGIQWLMSDDGGYIEADFATGDFEVMCPYALITAYM